MSQFSHPKPGLDIQGQISELTELLSVRQQQDDRLGALKIYEEILLRLLSAALREQPSGKAAVEWWGSFDMPSILETYAVQFEEIMAEVDGGAVPPEQLPANYRLLVACHLAALHRDRPLLTRLLAIASHPALLSQSTPFWAAYAAAFQSLLTQSDVTLPTFSPIGLGKLWYCHLKLMLVLRRNPDPVAELEQTAQAFKAVAWDSKIRDDDSGIEKVTVGQLRWDFRRESLLALVR